MATIQEQLRAGWAARHRKTVDEAADVIDAFEAFAEAFLANYSKMEDGDGNEAPEIAMARAALSRARGDK